MDDRQDATHMVLLARTDPEAKRKQVGISFMLMDLRTDGVSATSARISRGE